MAHVDGSKKKLTLYNIFILMFVALGSVTYGYTASIIGTTLGLLSIFSKSTSIYLISHPGQPTFIKYFALDQGNGTDLLSTMNGLFQAGGVIGTLLLPTVADRWGRKWALAVVRICSHFLNFDVGGVLTIGGCYVEYCLGRCARWQHTYR